MKHISEILPDANGSSLNIPKPPVEAMPRTSIWISKSSDGLEFLYEVLGFEDAPGGKGTVWKTYHEMVAIKEDIIAHTYLEKVNGDSFKSASFPAFAIYKGEGSTQESNRLDLPTTSGSLVRPFVKSVLTEATFVPPKGFEKVQSNPILIYRNFNKKRVVSKESLEPYPIEISVKLNEDGEPSVIEWSTKMKVYKDENVVRLEIDGYTETVIGRVPAKVLFSDTFGKSKRIEAIELASSDTEMPVSFWKLAEGKQVRDYRLSGLARGENAFFKKSVPPVAYAWEGKPLSLGELKKREPVKVVSSPFVKGVVPGGSAQLTNLAVIVVSAVAVVGLFVWIAMGIMKRKAA